MNDFEKSPLGEPADGIEVSQEIKERNRELCRRFPFLIPSNRWSGMKITEAVDGGYWPGDPKEIPKYDYEYTELDDMPDGWRKAFGEQMCQEIMDELVANDMVDTYRIMQIKEKYGDLRWYDNGFTRKGFDIIEKYSALSAHTCIKCGKPATRVTTGWIAPYCDECCPSVERSVPIEEESE